MNFTPQRILLLLSVAFMLFFCGAPLLAMFILIFVPQAFQYYMPYLLFTVVVGIFGIGMSHAKDEQRL